MQLKGHKVIEATPEVSFRLLTDPEVLVRTMPGLKEMSPDGEGKYRAVMEMGVGAIRGRYAGTMSMADVRPPESYRLLMDGQGPGGFVNVDLTVRFQPDDKGCAVHYDGEAKVGGTVAGVGQRMLGGVASFIMNQFFDKIAKEAQKA
jgi:carbon monoxide dehydrogenase subunit G